MIVSATWMFLMYLCSFTEMKRKKVHVIPSLLSTLSCISYIKGAIQIKFIVIIFMQMS